NARAQGTLEGGKLEAKIAAGPVDIELPETPSRDIQDLDPPPDFVIHGQGREQQATAGGGTLQLILHLDAPDVTLHSIDANLTAAARINLRRDPPQAGGVTLANSRVTVKRGNVIVLGRRFEVERGLLFYNSQDPPSDPHLDVLASYDSPYAQVRVTVNGTAKK